MRLIAALLALCAAAALGQTSKDLEAELRDAGSYREVVEAVERFTNGIPKVTTWYIKSGESGGGTSTSDYAGTWAAIAGSLGAGDTVYIHGDSVLREAIDITVANLTVAAEPGTGRWQQTGRQLVAAGDWVIHTAVSGRTIYKNAIGEQPSGFTYGYAFANVTDADGISRSIPTGHLPKSAETTLANFITDITNNDRPSWYYNSGNTTLYVYFPSNADPRSSGVDGEWFKSNGSTAGFRRSAGGVSVSGGFVNCWLPLSSATTQWMGQLNGVTGCVTTDMWFDSGFYHLDGATGGVCQNNTWSNCVFYTVARGTDASIVQYSNSGALTGGIFQDCTVHLSDLRKYDGTPLNAFASSAAIKGLAGHSGASGSIGASGLIYRRITTIDYSDCHSSGGTQATAFSGGNGSAPSDRWDPSAYQIRIQDSTLRSAIGGQCQSTAYVALERTSMVADGSTSGGISQACFNVASGGQLLLESSTLVGTLSATTNDVVIRAADKVSFSNASVRAMASTDGILFGTAAASYQARHSIFSRENAGNFCKGGSMPQPTFTKCWYDVLIGDTVFATPTAFNSQTEWTSLIDPDGTYDVDFSTEFADDTLEPVPGGLVHSAHDRTGNSAAPVGINRHRYEGNPGAWQFGQGGARGRSRLRTRSRNAY